VARARLLCASTFSVIAVCIAPYHVIMIGLYPDYNVCAIVKQHEEVEQPFFFLITDRVSWEGKAIRPSVVLLFLLF